MASILWSMLSDSSTVPLITTAVCTAAYASYRANDVLLKRRYQSGRHHPSPSEQFIDDTPAVLEGSMAMAIPLIAAASILLLFFFLHSVGFILTTFSAISSFFAVLYVLWPFSETLIRRAATLGLPVRSSHSLITTIAALPTTVLVLYWLFTGNWLANNLIGISLCVLFATFCRVPNLKVTVILFTGLFIYDIFFVFFSERFFGRNVMVEVATSTPTNPAAAIASLLHLPFSPVKNLALPAKLIIPTKSGMQSILGLGDIILPEVLLTLLLEFDLRVSFTPLYRGYFARALLAYFLAITLSFYSNYAFQAAQPALLYIVPACLATTLWLARSKGHLSILWNGPPSSEDGHPPQQGQSSSADTSEETHSLMEDKPAEESSLLAQQV